MLRWMLMPFRRYADFSGRSQRKEYWLYTLFYLAVTVVLYAIMMAGLPWSEIWSEANNSSVSDGGTVVRTGIPQNDNALPGPLFWLGLVLVILWFIGTLVPNIAITVRRFHDQNLSGWLYLLYLIPYLGFIVILIIMCIEGTRGPNRFGDDPTGANNAVVFE